MANTNRFSARDVINTTNASESAVYRYLLRFEETCRTNMRDANGNWSLTNAVFDRVVSFINRERTAIGV